MWRKKKKKDPFDTWALDVRFFIENELYINPPKVALGHVWDRGHRAVRYREHDLHPWHGKRTIDFFDS